MEVGIVAFVFLTAFFVVSARVDIVRNAPLSYGNFVKMEGFVLRGNAMASMSETDGRDVADTCAVSCIKTPGCESYNVEIGINNCSLMATDHYRNASSLEALQSHNYYYRASACDSSPCQNGGTCTPLFSLNTMKCFCTQNYVGDTCEVACDRGALGMESGGIADSQLSQSSYDVNDQKYGAHRGRLNTPDWPHGALFLQGSSDQWFQVDLLAEKYVTGLATQGYGYPSSAAYVTTYQISWSRDGTTWSLYLDDQQMPKTFVGNTDNQGIVKNEFKPAIKARWIKIVTKTCMGDHCSLRIELYGCPI